MRRGWIALGAFLAAGAAAAAFATFAWRALHAELPLPPDGAWLEVASGTPLRRVTADLAQRGLLDHPVLLDVYARLRGDATRIRAGEYQLGRGLTPLSLVDKLVSGQVFQHQLTIVEGWRFVELLNAVRAQDAIRAGTQTGAEIMAELGEPGVHPEGQFFPDTYFFPRGTTDIELLKTAHQALLEHLAKAWDARRPDVQLRSPYDALILASIIEKETALPTERRLISGVFQQRLRRNMRLQTDPTVIYGLGDAYDGNLRRQDLERDTPYNTYTRAGLPPTPIALPGNASLEAATDPDDTGALYFVATGRGDGSHSFSATLEEHERAVRDYLRRLHNAEP
ncbi:MAG TPA: endolytic transglycosylase MltG [Gammaproteobacteria bacterium]|nr:endolytic transglycosylase MltG [Gammaproteobacteria bacterium]